MKPELSIIMRLIDQFLETCGLLDLLLLSLQEEIGLRDGIDHLINIEFLIFNKTHFLRLFSIFHSGIIVLFSFQDFTAGFRSSNFLNT